MSSPDLQGPQTRGAGTQHPLRAARGNAGEPDASLALERRRALLAFGGPREVLARIVEGDPLGLRPLIAAQVRARCVFVDADRVQLLALALCARDAPAYRGRPALDEWLLAQVERALDELVQEESERLDLPPARGVEEGAFAQLARPLGLEPAELRRSCARFNRLPQESREAFNAWVLERGSLDALAQRSRAGAAELARRALVALMGAPPESGSGGAQEYTLDPVHPIARSAGPSGPGSGAKRP